MSAIPGENGRAWTALPAPPLERVLRRSQFSDKFFTVLGWVLMSLALLVLGLLVVNLAKDGLARINWQFLTSFPSRKPAEAGIKSAWVGSLLVMLVTAATAIPVGIAAGIYLEEYARKNWFTTIIEVNISNLASVPSIIYGLMALGLFIYKFEDWFGAKDDDVTGLGHSIITAGLTLALLVLPIVIVATREALRAIPQAIREAAYALGASRWQVIRHHLLPYSMGGISTGVIISLSRAIGETAPLVTVGALAYVALVPPYPFQAKSWNGDEDVVLVGSVTTPLSQIKTQKAVDDSPSPEAAPALAVAPGTLSLLIRHEEDRSKSRPVEVDIPVRLDEPLGTLIASVENVDGLRAEFDEYSTFHIVAEPGVRWRVKKDTSGLVAATGLPAGGGVFGPLEWVHSPYTVLPIQMFNWVSRPDPAFLNNAAAAGLVLMFATLGMNAGAIVVRARMRRRIKW